MYWQSCPYYFGFASHCLLLDTLLFDDGSLSTLFCGWVLSVWVSSRCRLWGCLSLLLGFVYLSPSAFRLFSSFALFQSQRLSRWLRSAVSDAFSAAFAAFTCSVPLLSCFSRSFCALLHQIYLEYQKFFSAFSVANVSLAASIFFFIGLSLATP